MTCVKFPPSCSSLKAPCVRRHRMLAGSLLCNLEQNKLHCTGSAKALQRAGSVTLVACLACFFLNHSQCLSVSVWVVTSRYHAYRIGLGTLYTRLYLDETRSCSSVVLLISRPSLYHLLAAFSPACSSGSDQPAVEVAGAHYGSVWDVHWHPLGHLLARRVDERK